MAKETEVTVKVEIPSGPAIRLMQRMAREILELYSDLDEVASLAGIPAYPKNTQLIADVDEFVESIEVTT